MNLIELLAISLGISIDAFSVTMCEGISLSKNNKIKALMIGFIFGLFQILMLITGHMLSLKFKKYILLYIPWIAFILLLLIGLKMIKNSYEDKNNNLNLNFKTIILLAFITSIDAVAVGVTLIFIKINVINSILFIGFITFLFSYIGTRIGSLFGSKFNFKIEFIGGIILIIIAFKTLLW